ncbi:MAG: type II secretion system protein [Candidatus Shapirobacteria bacterium]
MKIIKRTGFTLVELLIVIALIAILSVAVLATINPIEQSNKARDAKFKNDTAEVLGAYERYYASQNVYPWNNGVGATVAFGAKFATGSTDPAFGVLGAGTSMGVLITTSELKSSFAGKEAFNPAMGPVDRMYVYFNGLDSSYVCFVPKATANRFSGGSPNPNLKCLDLVTPALLNIGGNCAAVADWSLAASLLPGATLANMVCVPEGTVQ